MGYPTSCQWIRSGDKRPGHSVLRGLHLRVHRQAHSTALCLLDAQCELPCICYVHCILRPVLTTTSQRHSTKEPQLCQAGFSRGTDLVGHPPPPIYPLSSRKGIRIVYRLLSSRAGKGRKLSPSLSLSRLPAGVTRLKEELSSSKIHIRSGASHFK